MRAAAVVEPFLKTQREKSERASSVRGLVSIAAVFAAGTSIVNAWSPAALTFAALVFGDLGPSSGTTPLVVAGLGLALFAAGFAYAVRHPERGLQDRIAGTWLVPR